LDRVLGRSYGIIDPLSWIYMDDGKMIWLAREFHDAGMKTVKIQKTGKNVEVNRVQSRRINRYAILRYFKNLTI